MRTTVRLMALILFFSGCSQKATEQCDLEYVYVDTPVPRLKILNAIKPYQIQDITPLGGLSLIHI